MRRILAPTVERIDRITAILRRDYPAPECYLAERLGHSANAVRGTLVVMMERGLVRRDPNGWYRLGASQGERR
jgi:DNA-binding IclR family transcriptional regulator